MNRFQYYERSKILASDLGLSKSSIASKWRSNSTILYWKKYTLKLEKEKIKRNKLFSKAETLSRELRVPLSRSSIAGTSHKVWKNELQKIRMKRLRAVRTGAKRARSNMKQVLPQLTTLIENKRINKLINNRISNNQFQELMDDVVNNGYTLSNSQIERLWIKINEDYYSLTINTINGDIITVAFNQNSKDFIDHILKNGTIINEEDEFGSDKLNRINITQINQMTITRFIPDRNIINNDGAFFPYINTSSIPLTDYQIFNQDEATNIKQMEEREQCLIHTLLKAGVEKSVVNKIKLAYINGASISKKDLHKISDIIKRNIIIYTFNNKEIKKQKIKPQVDTTEVINIALYENHYFLYEETKYSICSIKNYIVLKDVKDFHNIVQIKKEGGRIKYVRNNTKKINSLKIVSLLFNEGYFKKLDMVHFAETASHIGTREHIYLNSINHEQQKIVPAESLIKNIQKLRNVYFADCETFTNGVKHELYMLGYVKDDDNLVNIACHLDTDKMDAQKIVYKFFNHITVNGNNDALVYFHNLKYDYNILEKYLNIKKKCEKDGQLYSVECMYKNKIIELRDSFKMIPFALSKFGDEFDLPRDIRKKEAIAYGYYTPQNHNQIILVDEYKKLLPFNEQHIFTDAIKENEGKLNFNYNSENKTFNPTEYYKEYLRLDCLVLKEGMKKFNNLIMELTDDKMCVYDCLTVSSLTDKYMREEEAYDGVWEISGNLRAYVAEAVYGGRVNVNEKYKKQVIEQKISDYDGVSLYPSAINRLCRPSKETEQFYDGGLPIGVATRYKQEELTQWKNMTYSVLTVKITQVKKTQQMPFIAHKGKSSIAYLNTPPLEPVIIDSITLEDYINFHDIEYELIDGVYWNSGINNKMGKIVKKLFDMRLKCKTNNNTALSNVIKLMLNSSYGKTIMKKSKYMKKIIMTKYKQYDKVLNKWVYKNKTNWNNYVCRNFNTIKEWRQLNDDTYEVKSICADDTYNRGHIGCAILSMSKRIMNEVFDIANTHECPIYYTDTDSMHCNYDDLTKIEEQYNNKYQKKLNGKNLEQFHTDFSLKGAHGEIYATKSIFLGKKSYMDYLESTDKDGNIINGFHTRLKGITREGMKHTAKEYKDGYMGLYTDLAKGIEKNMVLNPFDEDNNSQKVLFEFKKGTVSFKKEFIRKVKF